MRICNHHPLMTVSLIAVVSGSFLIQGSHVSRADDRQKKQIVSGILRLILESQNRSRRPQPPPPPPPQNNRRVPKDVLDSRAVLSNMANESAGLVNLLNTQVATTPSLRPYLADALKFRARSMALAQASQNVVAPQQLVPGSQTLDRDWRVLAYRLQHTPGLSRTCSECIGRLNGNDQQLCALLKIAPQVDYDQLDSEAHALCHGIARILDDLDIELGRRPKDRTLITEGRRVAGVANLFKESIHGQSSHAILTKHYQGFLREWTPFLLKLQSLRSRYIERGLERIAQSDDRIHELLWLPRGIDRAQLQHVCERIQDDVEAVFNAITLTQIMRLPDPEAVPASAAELLGVCQNLTDCVRRGESPKDLVDAYAYVPVAWVGFSRQFRSFQDPAFQTALSRIEHSVVALREPLRLTPELDRQACTKLAGSLELLCEHLADDVGNWLNSAEGRKLNFRVQLAQDLTVFVNESHNLHQRVLANQSNALLGNSCSTLAATWERIHRNIAQCNTRDRAHLLEISKRITSTQVELQAMLLL